MKPANVEYRRAHSVRDALGLLAEYGEDAKVLAGGQSLVPMMSLRLARPTALVDIGHLSGLDGVERVGDELRVGALARHRALETTRDPAVLDGFRLLPDAARWIGHYPIRCRGTVGGSIAHSDSAAEWCMLARLFDARIVVEGTRGRRQIEAVDWFQGFLTTAADTMEIVVEVRFARPRSHGALAEYARRRGDFALAAVGVSFDLVDGHLKGVGVVFGGVGATPVRSAVAEAVLEGVAHDDVVARAAAAEAATSAIDPVGDHHGDSRYRRHLVGNLLQRAVREAVARPARPCPTKESR